MSAFLQAQCTLPPDEPKERMRKCTTTPHIAKDGSDLLASSGYLWSLTVWRVELL